jgi:N-acetylglutamate synthase-like GNAT family acetyltransferase
LKKNEEIAGCAGIITNNFISRMDLYPWLCALHIAENHRGNHYGTLLINQAKEDAKETGYRFLNLSTSHIGYYEKLGFQYNGQGYHPWGETSRIYQIEL